MTLSNNDDPDYLGPDVFVFQIYDDATGLPIPTTDPSSFLMAIYFDSKNPSISTFNMFDSEGEEIGCSAPTVTPVPEPMSLLLLGLGLKGVTLVMARHRLT